MTHRYIILQPKTSRNNMNKYYYHGDIDDTILDGKLYYYNKYDEEFYDVDGIHICKDEDIWKYIDHMGLAYYICDIQIRDRYMISAVKSVTIINKRTIWDNEELCLIMLEKKGTIIKYIEKPTEKMCNIAIKANWRALQFITEQTYELCTMALNKSEYAIRYIKNQTDDMCLLATRRNWCILQHIKNQTELMCKRCINQNWKALLYVKNQTPMLIEFACKKNKNAKLYIRK